MALTTEIAQTTNAYVADRNLIGLDVPLDMEYLELETRTPVVLDRNFQRKWSNRWHDEPNFGFFRVYIHIKPIHHQADTTKEKGERCTLIDIIPWIKQVRVHGTAHQAHQIREDFQTQQTWSRAHLLRARSSYQHGESHLLTISFLF